MTRNEWMRGEIGSWVGDGLIDAELGGKLESRYPVSDGRMPLGTVIVGAFGAMLVGLGIIALFAANWDEFGRVARAVISVTPMALCGIGAAVAARRGTKSAAVWEPLGILWAISVAAGTSLVAQTYQIGGSVPGLILLVALLTLPIAWVVPSASVMALWTAYPVLWAMAKCDCACSVIARRSDVIVHADVFAGALALMALSVPAYVAYLKRRGERGPFPPVQFVTGLSYSVGLAIIAIRTFNYDFFDVWPYVYTLWAGAAVVGVLGRVFKLPVWPFVATLVASLSALPFGVDDDPGNYVLALLLAVATVAYGIHAVRLAYVNVGSLLAIWLVLAKFFASDISFTVKGIVLVLCGAVLTTANVVFIRLKKSGRISK